MLQGQNKLFVAVVYRPPNTPFFKGTDFLYNISTLSHDYSNKIILGDFNSNMLNYNPNSSIISDFIQDNNLKLIPHGVTCIKDDSETHIDLCLVDENEKITNYQKSAGPFIGFHFLISVTLQLFLPCSNRSSFTYRNISKIDPHEFSSVLLSLNWNLISAQLDVNSMLQTLETNILTTLDQLAPLRSIISKRKLEPCITTKISSRSQNTDRLYRR